MRIGEHELALIPVTSLWKVDHIPVAFGDGCTQATTPKISPSLEECCHLAQWVLLELSDLKEGSARLLIVTEAVVDPTAQELSTGSLCRIKTPVSQYTIQTVQCACEVSLSETCDRIRQGEGAESPDVREARSLVELISAGTEQGVTSLTAEGEPRQQ